MHAASGRKPELPASLVRLPLVRGVARMGEMLALLPIVRKGLPQARLPFEDPRVGAAILATSIATGGLRKSRLSPGRVRVALGRRRPRAAADRAALVDELAGYHGAEHKAIGAYEHGGEPFDVAKEHERCGTHLVGPLVGATAIANVLAAQLPERARKPAALGGSLVAMGVAVEVFSWVDRHRGSRVALAALAARLRLPARGRDRGAVARAARGRRAGALASCSQAEAAAAA